MIAPYTFTRDDAEFLMGAVQLPADLRLEVIRRYSRRLSGDQLISLFSEFIGLAARVVENNREMVELVLIAEGGFTERMAESINLPTLFGALQGCVVAEGIDQSALCPGCAFRPGTCANTSPSTTTDADWCGHPGEAPFMCHADLDEHGEPVRACPGFAQLRARRKRELAA